jgi:hypothetical protein
VLASLVAELSSDWATFLQQSASRTTIRRHVLMASR